MKPLREIYQRNPLLAVFGAAHFLLALLLAIYGPFNTEEVLGLNSVIKPIKFALSIGVFSWTMAWFLPLLQDQRQARRYSRLQVFCLGFEQVAITGQALRGEQSHFNTSSPLGIAIFSLMGVLIMLATLSSLRLWWQLHKQQAFKESVAYVAAVKNGLLLFVVFSLFGGFIGSYGKHTVGGFDGTDGIPFLNWSLHYGDLRIAHFFGIHSLQLIPLFAVLFAKGKSAQPVQWFTLLWLQAVGLTAVQALLGLPLISA
ncbi:MAG: hypothetical protein ACK5U7_09905 [Bacteroidota bacterium]|jgi:hypothetical protein